VLVVAWPDGRAVPGLLSWHGVLAQHVSISRKTIKAYSSHLQLLYVY
jgi:hypothetical protein